VAVAPSLFETSPEPALSSAADWISGALLGSVAVALCVIAIAFVGLMLMAGRLAVRDALRVTVGCFVLLGAPTIAAGLGDAAEEVTSSVVRVEPVVEAYPTQPPLPQSTYDPYAGASLRKE
jgi:type IV secretory pathway VirB2 component (pilin)